VLAAGGSGGSSIAAQVMAALPVGLPKLLVSTMASGDVSPYVGAKDVCVMYSVVDVAGVNRISRLVLGNAAAAMAGMALARAGKQTGKQTGEQAGEQASGDDDRPLVAASMFGVTTPAVETARSRLAGLGYEVLVFHATGAGGRALEALAEARLLAGLIDGVFRQNLEETGMGFGLETGMIRQAAERGMVTCPYVFDPGQAAAMARAGADILVPHMGLTTSGTIGARTALTLGERALTARSARSPNCPPGERKKTSHDHRARPARRRGDLQLRVGHDEVVRVPVRSRR